MLAPRSTKTRILIVDDSSFMRMAIRSILSKDPSLEIVGIAADGMEGVEKAVALKPDLVTMDVEMPRMDGISALRQIMAKAPTKVIMVSTLTNEGARSTFEALDAGAIDYIPKNVTDSSEAQNIFREELLRKVKETMRSRFGRTGTTQAVRQAVAPAAPRAISTKLAGKKNKLCRYRGINRWPRCSSGSAVTNPGKFSVRNYRGNPYAQSIYRALRGTPQREMLHDNS